MKLLPFDLEKALNGHPWGTRDVEGAKLLDTEREDRLRWIAIFKDGRQSTYSSKGENYYLPDYYKQNLFLYSEQKTGWVVVFECDGDISSVSTHSVETKLLYENHYKGNKSYIATFEVNY